MKMPGTPKCASSTGARTSATTNDRPMLMPMTAMERVRTSGRVRSASSAVTAADTAPAPWMPRATASMVTRVRQGAHQRADGKHAQSPRDQGLAPNAVGPAAERDLQDRLGQAVGAHRQAEHLGRVVGQAAGVQRQHRQRQEQAQHAGRVDRGQRGHGAALRAGHDRLGGGIAGSDRFCLGVAAPPILAGCLSAAVRRISEMDFIRIRGARTHNLQGIDLDLPRDRLIVITGLSGSGKSSLAFDTIYAEGQRRYVESLSAYARQFLSVMEKPDVDHIEGLSPGHLDRAEGHVAQPALDRRHRHRDLRLPARAVRARRRAALPGPRAGARGPVRQPDGRPGARAARGHGRAAARAGGAGPQGRARGGVRPAARPGFRAGDGRRQAGRTRGKAEARSTPPALDRRRRRPPEGARRRVAAARGIVRDGARARAGRRARRLPRRARAGADRLLEPLRLHGVRLQPRRARAAALLVQQPERRLRHLRRPRRAGVLRSGARGGEPGAVARGRARSAAGTAAMPTTSS